MTMEKIENKFAILIAETGVFFAKCDNQYDEIEKKFIYEYSQKLDGANIVDKDIIKIISELDGAEFNFETIINHTNELILNKSTETQNFCINNIKQFILKLIEVDGVIHTNEKHYFEEWNKIFEKYLIN